MNNMNEYFFTAHSVVTDDDGYLGYLWKGIYFEDRKTSNKGDFIPITTDELFYSPKEAIKVIKTKYNNKILNMNNKEKKLWLNSHYPTTIVQDRYTGVYSGGIWTCWPLEFYMVPEEIDGYDTECSCFWDSCDKSVIGLGSTPDEALKDLELKFFKSIFNANKTSE